jgi:hypothetical protein
MTKPIYSSSRRTHSPCHFHQGLVPYDWIDDYDMTTVTFLAQYDCLERKYDCLIISSHMAPVIFAWFSCSDLSRFDGAIFLKQWLQGWFVDTNQTALRVFKLTMPVARVVVLLVELSPMC